MGYVKLVAIVSLLMSGCNGDGAVKSDGMVGGDGSTTGDLGASTGVLKCGTYSMPPFSKACAKTADCVLVTHTIDCCGSGKAIGLAASDEAAFKAEEAKCAATYPGCGCPTGPTRTEDGSKAPMTANAVAVECVAGICTSYVAACGKVCDGALTCRSCTRGPGKLYAACSEACTADGDCKDPALPSCVSDNMGGMFCAAAADSCAP
jgi:hypothetical protein